MFEETAFLGYMILALLEPGVLDDIITKGEIEGLKITPELLLVFAILVLVPLVMAFLSLTLKDSANRWANVIVGIVLIGLNLIDLEGALANMSAWGTLVILSKVAALALIVWYAWKSKQKA